jgi:hypothetical protein
MTVDTTYTPAEYTGDGSTTAFALSHLVYESSHILVTVDGVTDAAWSATGYGLASGVTVTMDTAPASATSVVVQRIVPYTQDTDLENFDGNPADVTEKQFDLLAMADQQIAESNSRTITSPIGTALTSNEISGTITASPQVLTITTAGPAASSLGSISSTIDTAFTSLASGDFFQYNGANWVNITTIPADKVGTPTADNTFSGDNTFTGDNSFIGKTATKDAGELTIATGAVAVIGSNHTVDTEGDAASDDLDTISGGVDGELVVIRAENDARTVVVKHNTGNILSSDAEDISLDNTTKNIFLTFDEALSKWVSISQPASARPFLHIQDQKTSGTDGGTFTSGAWQTRVLNTVVTNGITGSSLLSNQITLPAGTYYIEAKAVCLDVNIVKAKIYNATDTSDILIGLSQLANSTANAAQVSQVGGEFTLAAEKVIELQHRCASTRSSDGFGTACGFGVVEVYSDVKIWKI